MSYVSRKIVKPIQDWKVNQTEEKVTEIHSLDDMRYTLLEPICIYSQFIFFNLRTVG